MLGSEPLRAFCDKINVRAFAKNFTGSANRIRDTLNASHAPGAQSSAIHNEGIELDLAVAIQKAAAPGVECLVVFHDGYGFFDRVERRSAAFEDAPSGGSAVADAVAVSIHHVIGNGPGAAVNDKNGIRRQTYPRNNHW